MSKTRGCGAQVDHGPLPAAPPCHGKIAYLEEEHGDAVEVMRAIKRALDPDNLMNPGKIFPPGGLIGGSITAGGPVPRVPMSRSVTRKRGTV